MSGGKGGGGKTIIGYDYYASFAGVAGIGPVDALLELVVDAKSAWVPASPVLRADAANPYVLDVEGRGTVYFYWGTEDQALADPVLATETSPGVWAPRMSRGGFPYRRRVLVVFEDFKCGFERLSVPDVQVVYRRAADQQVVTATAAGVDDGQVNPVAALAELLVNPTSGLGSPVSRLDGASWQATAEALHTTRSEHYLSMLIDQKMRLPEVLEEVNGYADTWFRVDEAGRLAVGRWATGEAPADLPEVTQHDLTEPPSIRAHGYAELDDRVVVNYRDREQAYADAQVRYDTPLNRGLAEMSQDAETSRPWITRPDQAAAQAVAIGLRQSTPWDAVSLSVREARVLALGLKVGDQFVCDYAPLSYRAVCRVLTLSGFVDGGGPVRIEAETDRNLGPAAFAPSVTAPPREDEASIEALVYFDVIQATPELAGGQTYRLVPLAARHQPTVRFAEVWWHGDGSTEFTLLGGLAVFAVPVELAAAYADTEPLEDTTGALQVQEQTTEVPVERITGLDADQSAEQIADDNLLLFLLDGAGGYEVLTVRSIESPTGGVFPLHVNRARLGTSRLDHADGAKGYLVERDDLTLLTSSAFAGVADGGTTTERTIALKAAPTNTTQTLDLVDAAEVTLELAEQEVLDVTQVATPVATPEAGDYPAMDFPLSVELTTTEDAAIRWSTDAVPNSETEGAAYTGAIAIDAGDTIYAKAFRAGMLPSNALIAPYTEAGS